MGRDEVCTVVVVDEQMLAIEELALICGVSTEWVFAHVQAGVLPATGSDPSCWRFSGGEIRRVRRLLALERDFAAEPELAALVLDLQEEIARLRAMLRQGLG